MKTQTLLEKARAAKAYEIGAPASEEELDLMIAYMNGDITSKQTCAALDVGHRTAVTQRCAIVLRAAIESGAIARIERIHTKNGK